MARQKRTTATAHRRIYAHGSNVIATSTGTQPNSLEGITLFGNTSLCPIGTHLVIIGDLSDLAGEPAATPGFMAANPKRR